MKKLYIWAAYGDITTDVFSTKEKALKYVYDMFPGCNAFSRYNAESDEYYIRFDYNNDDYFVTIEKLRVK